MSTQTAEIVEVKDKLPIEIKREPVDRFKREVVVVDYEKMETITMSMREKFVVNTSLDMVTGNSINFNEVARRVNYKFGGNLKGEGIKKWMDRNDRVKAYLRQQMIHRGIGNNWTEAKYKAACIASLEGKPEHRFEDGQVMRFNRGTPYYLKLVGEILGYVGKGSSFRAENMQINFVQKNGNL